jgi:ceramide glucosyltransferase
MIPTLFETAQFNWQSAIVTFFVFFSGALYTLGSVMAFARLRRKARVQIVPTDCRISVIKPLRGLDPQLAENLASFARLEAPPEFEVILCVADENDLALTPARRMVLLHPRRFKLIVGANPKHFNGKIAVLSIAIPHAKNDLLWLSDSNVETSQAFMHSLLASWKESNLKTRLPTLVHAPLVAVGGDSSMGGALERMHVASFVNCGHELSLLGGVHAVIGKNLLMHRNDLALVGGIDAFGSYLGDDFLIGCAFQKAGVVVCASVPTRNVIGPLRGREWFSRHTRWALLRKTMKPAAFFTCEPFIYSATPMLMGAFGLVSAEIVLGVMVYRVLIDIACFSMHAREAPRLCDILISPLKELILVATWVAATTTNHVTWRQDAFRVGSGSALVARADEPSKLKRLWNRVRRIFIEENQPSAARRWLEPRQNCRKNKGRRSN